VEKNTEFLSVEVGDTYAEVLISLWLFQFPIFIFAAQPKEFFLCVERSGNI
jgi:hypothetical protein